MMVFYYTNYDGTLRYDFIRYLSEVITPCDVSYWAIPGTLED